jgi:hypothetical protein
MLIVIMLSVAFYCYAERRYAECLYAKCRGSYPKIIILHGSPFHQNGLAYKYSQ